MPPLLLLLLLLPLLALLLLPCRLFWCSQHICYLHSLHRNQKMTYMVTQLNIT
jgi:hypothetical protein